MDIFIKEDNGLKMFFRPIPAGTLKYDKPVVNKITGKRFDSEIQLYKYNYDFNGNRLEKPLFTPTNVFILEEEYNG